MPQENQIAQPVHLGVGAQHIDGLFHIPRGKGAANVGQHFFQHGRHVREVARVLRIDPGAGRLRAAGKTEQQIPDAFQADHEFHAGQQLASFGFGHLRDGERNPIVDFAVERVEFLLALPDGIEQRRRAGRNTLGGRSGCILGNGAGVNRSFYQVRVGRLRHWSVHAGDTHRNFPRLTEWRTHCSRLSSLPAWTDGHITSISSLFQGCC